MSEPDKASDERIVPKQRGETHPRAVGAPAVQRGLAEALGLAPEAEAAILDGLTERERDAISYAAAAAREGLDLTGGDVFVEDN